MFIVSKDDTWTAIRLFGEVESCDISVRDFGADSRRILTTDDGCQFLTNSKNIDIICTKNRKVCKRYCFCDGRTW